MIENYDTVDVFIGVDVGTGEHHAVALDWAGKQLFDKALLAFARSRNGIDWNSADGSPATLVFMIAVPEAAAGTEHLTVLAQLSRALMKPAFRAALQSAVTPADVLEALAGQVGAKKATPAAT